MCKNTLKNDNNLKFDQNLVNYIKILKIIIVTRIGI